MIVLGLTGYARDMRGAARSPLLMARDGFDGLFRFRHGEVPFPCFPLGFFGHDGAAALVVDGEVVAAASEERFTRVKHGLNLAGRTLLPRRSVEFCLGEAGLDLGAVDRIAHYCDFAPDAIEDRLALLAPHLEPDDLERTRASYRDIHDAMLRPEAVRAQVERMTDRPAPPIVPVRHHLAHAASAFHPSGFDEALVLTLDGTGERESSILAVGRHGRIEEIDHVPLPTSLGTLYLVVTVFLGFRSLGDEFKVMGLAAYGDPGRYREFFRRFLEDGEDVENGDYSTARMTAASFRDDLEEALGPPRRSGEDLEARHADVAAALQEALVRAVLRQVRRAREATGLTRLCLAGGVALNCALNGAIARSGLFEEIFVQPAAGDEGCSVGAALHEHHREAGRDGTRAAGWAHAFLGPAFTEAEVSDALDAHSDVVRWKRVEDVADAAAELLERSGVVAWFQGRMEFGPRALGHRSILADPREPGMKDRINRLVKWREPFRPFAPATLEEEAAAWFDMTGLRSSPFMLFTVPVREERRYRIPAVTHVDGTARVQTVSRAVDPLFWRVIERFGRRTGVPVVLNTSFNVKGEPIVCSPDDALRCFLRTRLDHLAIGPCVVTKRS